MEATVQGGGLHNFVIDQAPGVPHPYQNGRKNCGHPRPVRTTFNLRTAEVDPLPGTTCDETPCLAGDCVESSQVSSAGPRGQCPSRKVRRRLWGLVGMLAPSFIHPRAPR